MIAAPLAHACSLQPDRHPVVEVQPARSSIGCLPSHSTALLVLLAVFACAGCGTTKSFTATEQLLVSDAVDTTVSKIDFRPLSGRKVFLDNSFMPTQKGVPTPTPSLVHSEYVTSSLRQQMLAAGVFICDKREDADVIVEARLGALGFDGHSVTYGVPASSSLSTAASTLSGSPIVPLLPELSFAKKEAKSGAAKVALFAYERQTLQPVWQSGIARASSTARDTWLLGIGPLQNGTIYEGTRFAGGKVLGKSIAKLVPHQDDEPEELVDYKRSQVFSPTSTRNAHVQTATLPDSATGSAVKQASGSAPAAASATATSPTATSPTAATPASAATGSPAPTLAPAVTSAAPASASQSPAAPAATTASSPRPAASPAAASSATANAMHLDDKPQK